MRNIRLGGTLIDVDGMGGEPSFDVAPDVYSWNYPDPAMVTWLIPSIPAGGCVSRTATFNTTPYGDRVTDGWYIEFDTGSQADRRIEVDPVMYVR